MNAFAVVALFGMLVAVSQASTTQKPHHTHHPHVTGPHTTKEPVEHEGFSFSYRNHVMYVHQGHQCYVATLTADEQVAVHTDSGLRALEIKLLGLLTTATSAEKGELSTQDQHACGNKATSFFLIP